MFCLFPAHSTPLHTSSTLNPSKPNLHTLILSLKFSPSLPPLSFVAMKLISLHCLFTHLLPLLIIFPITSQNPHSPRWTLINCGATTPSLLGDRYWLPDTDYISSGTPKTLETHVDDVTLSTARTFPFSGNVNRKFCYQVPVFRSAKYLVRTTYFHGGGDRSPPVFDQMVDGTFWSPVNTTDDFNNGLASYYEGIFLAVGKKMSVCIAANSRTDSDPFISALELVLLGNSLYNTTDFGKYGLRLVARHNFGYNGSIVRFPDDLYDRFWEPFGQSNNTISTFRNISVSGFWNLPPLKVFQTDMTNRKSIPMELLWPPNSLPESTYYISLYFAEDHSSSEENPRMFSVTVNNVVYYQNLNVTPAGVMVFANQWLLNGVTKITLTPPAGSNVIPLINAGEVFEVIPVGGRTLTRDVAALERIKKSFNNPPVDWNGDPCLPLDYRWSGVTCYNSKGPSERIRVKSLNLTNMDLSGSLSPSLANLTAISDIWLGNNSLSGPIPNLSPLKFLKTLHLEFNRLNGEIPPSLGDILLLSELFLQGNNLTGEVPRKLKEKSGLELRISPGNQMIASPPS